MKIKTLFETDLLTTFFFQRKKLKLTQKEVVKKLKISVMYLSYLEHGERELKLNLLDKWAESLGLEVLVEVREKSAYSSAAKILYQ